MPAVEKRRSLREVAALVSPAALLAGQRSGGDQPHQRVGVIARAMRSPSPSRSRPAWRHRAARDSSLIAKAGVAPGVGTALAAVRRRAAGLCRAPPEPRGRRRRSIRSASWRPGGWRRAVRCRSTRRRRRAPAATLAREGRWPPRPSCSERPGRPARARARGRSPRLRSALTTLGNSAGSTSRMSRPHRDAAGVDLALDGARDLVARGQLVDESLAGGVQQPGALAADRLGHQEPVERR